MESGIDASRRGPMPARTFKLTPSWRARPPCVYVYMRGRDPVCGVPLSPRCTDMHHARVRYLMLSTVPRLPRGRPPDTRHVYRDHGSPVWRVCFTRPSVCFFGRGSLLVSEEGCEKIRRYF